MNADMKIRSWSEAGAGDVPAFGVPRLNGKGR